MNDDVLPGLLKEVQDKFEQEFGKSETISNAFAQLKAKKVTYKTANDFAIEVGEILSKALTGSISADKLPDGKMYYNIAKRLLEPVLKRNHELVADYSVKTQTILNEKAKIGSDISAFKCSFGISLIIHTRSSNSTSTEWPNSIRPMDDRN